MYQSPTVFNASIQTNKVTKQTDNYDEVNVPEQESRFANCVNQDGTEEQNCYKNVRRIICTVAGSSKEVIQENVENTNKTAAFVSDAIFCNQDLSKSPDHIPAEAQLASVTFDKSNKIETDITVVDSSAGNNQSVEFEQGLEKLHAAEAKISKGQEKQDIMWSFKVEKPESTTYPTKSQKCNNDLSNRLSENHQHLLVRSHFCSNLRRLVILLLCMVLHCWLDICERLDWICSIYKRKNTPKLYTIEHIIKHRPLQFCVCAVREYLPLSLTNCSLYIITFILNDHSRRRIFLDYEWFRLATFAVMNQARVVRFPTLELAANGYFYDVDGEVKCYMCKKKYCLASNDFRSAHADRCQCLNATEPIGFSIQDGYGHGSERWLLGVENIQTENALTAVVWRNEPITLGNTSMVESQDGGEIEEDSSMRTNYRYIEDTSICIDSGQHQSTSAHDMNEYWDRSVNRNTCTVQSSSGTCSEHVTHLEEKRVAYEEMCMGVSGDTRTVRKSQMKGVNSRLSEDNADVNHGREYNQRSCLNQTQPHLKPSMSNRQLVQETHSEDNYRPNLNNQTSENRISNIRTESLQEVNQQRSKETENSTALENILQSDQQKTANTRELVINKGTKVPPMYLQRLMTLPVKKNTRHTRELRHIQGTGASVMNEQQQTTTPDSMLPLAGGPLDEWKTGHRRKLQQIQDVEDPAENNNRQTTSTDETRLKLEGGSFNYQKTRQKRELGQTQETTVFVKDLQKQTTSSAFSLPLQGDSRNQRSIEHTRKLGQALKFEVPVKDKFHRKTSNALMLPLEGASLDQRNTRYKEYRETQETGLSCKNIHEQTTLTDSTLSLDGRCLDQRNIGKPRELRETHGTEIYNRDRQQQTASCESTLTLERTTSDQRNVRNTTALGQIQDIDVPAKDICQQTTFTHSTLHLKGDSSDHSIQHTSEFQLRNDTKLPPNHIQLLTTSFDSSWPLGEACLDHQSLSGLGITDGAKVSPMDEKHQTSSSDSMILPENDASDKRYLQMAVETGGQDAGSTLTSCNGDAFKDMVTSNGTVGWIAEGASAEACQRATTLKREHIDQESEEILNE